MRYRTGMTLQEKSSETNSEVTAFPTEHAAVLQNSQYL